ncbi:putative inactive carboxylesterase 4, partial [Actinia tenebrosa]|uniref:Inactive carboxylesterase 4 n=1 Tax=Actinia tenebrosa TaxID=6105 RepID=A0A6P8HS00_ACTTE
MHRIFAQIVVIFIGLYSTCSGRDDSLVVDTAAGSVRGRLQNVIHGLSVKQFVGIPYAEPPVGELRFARPQPAKPWNGVKEAVKFGPICPQFLMKQFFSLPENITIEEEPQDEDCLTLNVYTPSQATSKDKLAIMVWIHGGGFVGGSGSSYNPSVLVAYHDVIVVTINYRLGVLGFFNIPGTDVKGNFGMLDQ